MARRGKINRRENSEVEGRKVKCTSFEIDKFYILPNLFYIFYFRQNNRKYKHE